MNYLDYVSEQLKKLGLISIVFCVAYVFTAHVVSSEVITLNKETMVPITAGILSYVFFGAYALKKYRG